MSDASPASKVKDSIKRLFRKRACIVLPKPSDGLIQSELDIDPSCKEALQSAIDFIQSSSGCKKVAGKCVSGAVICNMAQDFIHRFQKSASLLLIRAFERAVAAEARRHKEKLLVSFLDNITKLEQSLPTDEEKLLLEYQSAAKEVLTEFDKILLPMANQLEVLEERSSLEERMEVLFQELRENNANISLEHCRDLFNTLISPLKSAKLEQEELSDLERMWRSAFDQYNIQAKGPNRDSVLASEVPDIVVCLTSLIHTLALSYSDTREDLEGSITSLSKSIQEARGEEVRLKQALTDTAKAYEKQLEQKEQLISDLQGNVSSRIVQAENKSRDQAREIQTLRVELEQARKEKELMLEKERTLAEKRLQDLEAKLHRALLENERLEQALDRGREENDRLLAEKNESISQLSHQLRVLELHPEASPRQDSSLLRTLRQYLEDILNHFDSEQSARNKNINLLDQISRLQSELNQVRLKDQEAKMELIEEYEHKLRELRLEREASDRQYATAISQRLDELNSTQESVRQETERKNKLISEMESRLRRLEEDKQLRFEEFQEREQQLEDQYSVLSQHTKAIEALRAQMDDKDMAFALLRTDHEAEKDDNDILIHTIGFLLEYINRRRNAVPISHIHNEDNKAKLLALLSRFNVPTVTS
jgi:hypothetical protein